MKRTMLGVDVALREQVTQLARLLGMRNSEFLSMMLEEYLENHRDAIEKLREGRKEILKKVSEKN